MSTSDSLGKKPRPPPKAISVENNGATGSETIEGKRSPSQLRRARRRRNNGRRRANMPSVGEDHASREESVPPSGSAESWNDQLDHDFTIDARNKTDIVKPAQDEDEDEDDSDDDKDGIEKKGLKLRLELDLTLELELKAKIKGSVTLSLFDPFARNRMDYAGAWQAMVKAFNCLGTAATAAVFRIPREECSCQALFAMEFTKCSEDL